MARLAISLRDLPGTRTAVRVAIQNRRCETDGMPPRDIDGYLAGLDEPKRRTLQDLRECILAAAPDAEECISYGMPAFKVQGKVVAGFAAFKNHLSYLPHSGSVLTMLANDLAGFRTTKGSLHFTVDESLPPDLVAALVDARMRELGLTSRR